MSHDLEIYLHSRPPLEVIHNCLQRQRLVTLSEQKAGTITEIVVSTSDKEHLGASSFSVRSAISLLPDDIPDISLPEFQKATWLVTVSTGLFDKFSIAAAEKFCIDLVKSIGGAVYEPSNELVIFPKNRKYFLKHTDSSKQLKLITISWFCDEKDFLPEKAGQLLECLDSMFPECRPNRFGDGGPYQSPIEDKSKESFVAACRSEMSDIGILTWRGRHPCIEGTIYMPTSNRVHLSNERSCVSIDITFDCSFFEQDEMRCEKLVRLFVSIAEQLECFYAGAYVNFGEGAEGFGSPRAWSEYQMCKPG